MLDGLYASSVDGMTSMGKAEMFTSDGLYVSGGGCMTHVTGNTQPITSATYAWQYLTQEFRASSAIQVQPV